VRDLWVRAKAVVVSVFAFNVGRLLLRHVPFFLICLSFPPRRSRTSGQTIS